MIEHQVVNREPRSAVAAFYDPALAAKFLNQPPAELLFGERNWTANLRDAARFLALALGKALLHAVVDAPASRGEARFNGLEQKSWGRCHFAGTLLGLCSAIIPCCEHHMRIY